MPYTSILTDTGPGFNAEGGTKNFNFCTRASHSELHTCLRLVRSHRRPKDGYFLRAESFFNVASDFVLDERGYMPVAYEDTEHHQLTRRFLDDPSGMLKSVFAEDSDVM